MLSCGPANSAAARAVAPMLWDAQVRQLCGKARPPSLLPCPQHLPKTMSIDAGVQAVRATQRRQCMPEHGIAETGLDYTPP